MRLEERTHCPECAAEADIKKLGYDGIGDKIVKQTSEEIVIEITCKEIYCSNVWKAVFSFTGNQ